MTEDRPEPDAEALKLARDITSAHADHECGSYLGPGHCSLCDENTNSLARRIARYAEQAKAQAEAKLAQTATHREILSETANTRLRALVNTLVEALTHLKNECGGLLIEREAMRELLGNTNLACLELRRAEAEAALQKAREAGFGK